MEPLYTVRPINDRSPFHGVPASNRQLLGRSSWATTVHELRRELDAVDASDVVLEVDVRERDITVAGQLRADASTARTSPAVRLSMQTPNGPLQFATDVFGWDYNDRPLAQGWQQNVRAVVLGMESLRRVQRYGIAQNGEQYRGYLQIEAGVLPTSGMTASVALAVLTEEAGGDDLSRLDPDDPGPLRAAVKFARLAAHPDRNNGDRSRWNALEEAIKVLTRAGRL